MRKKTRKKAKEPVVRIFTASVPLNPLEAACLSYFNSKNPDERQVSLIRKALKFYILSHESFDADEMKKHVQSLYASRPSSLAFRDFSENNFEEFFCKEKMQEENSQLAPFSLKSICGEDLAKASETLK